MQELVDKYADKLGHAKLVEPGQALVSGLDAQLVWNRDDPACDVLEEVMAGLNINSLVFARPAEPYWTIIEHLAARHYPTIEPQDCETRTFLHDLPVACNFTAQEMISILKQRKSCIVPGHGITASGTVSPEQGFVTFSSVCFASFVKFFFDFLSTLSNTGQQQPDAGLHDLFLRVAHMTQDLLPLPETPPDLASGPFDTPDQVRTAMIQAGRYTVEYGLVDSYFGNISCLHNNILYISQTGSSLDELAGCIDPSPLDGSSSAGLTASSELSAHLGVIRSTGKQTILHGHPKFAVIQSMVCHEKDCENRGQCHLVCSHDRILGDIPVVPGEVGTGPYGLCHTLPPAMAGRRGVIVHGHGLFTVGETDYTDAFASLLDVEADCRKSYFDQVHALLAKL
mgnify:CR=1 FL=1